MEKKVENELNVYKKVIAEVELNFTDNEVKKSYELTNEDIDKLKKAAYTCIDVRYVKKTKRYNYILTTHLVANSLVFETRLTIDQCRRIFVSHGLTFEANKEYTNVPIYSHVRFLHGTRGEDGNVYVALQIFPYGKAREGKSRNTIKFLEFLTDEKIDVFEITKIVNQKTKETKKFSDIVLFWKNPENAEVIPNDELDYFNV